MNLQLKEIKLLASSGSLHSPQIVEFAEMYGSGFSLWFTAANGIPCTIRTQRNVHIVKSYKSLESATKTIKSLGFDTFEIKLIPSDAEIQKELNNEIFD